MSEVFNYRAPTGGVRELLVVDIGNHLPVGPQPLLHINSHLNSSKIILKFIWKDKGNRVAKIILKEIKLEEITLLDFNTL